MVGEDVVASEVVNGHSRAVSVLAGTVDVNNIIVRVFLLMKVLIIGRVAVGDAVRVSLNVVLLLQEILLGQLDVLTGDSAEMVGENVVASKVLSGNSRAISRTAGAVDINNSIVGILFLVEILIVSRVTVGDLLGVLVNRIEQLLVISRSAVMTSELVESRELQVSGSSGGGVESPVVAETVVVDNHIVVGSLVLELLVISRVAIAKVIRLSLDLDLGLLLVLLLVLRSQLDPVSSEAIVVNDTILGVNLVLKFLIVILVAIGELVRLLLGLELSKFVYGVLNGIDAAKERKNCDRNGFHVY